MSKAQNFSVTFLPANKSVKVAKNTLLIDAAAAAGMFIDLPCGGQGRCGRCRVKVDSGKVTHAENAHLTAQQIAEGWVLSCTARVAGDLVVTLPPAKERERIETPATRRAVSLRLDWPLNPAVRQVSVKVAAPTLEDPTPDLDRLSRALKEALGVEKLSFTLKILQGLSQTLRQGEWQVTAVIELAASGNEARVVDLDPGKPAASLLGLAVDIGTTNVVVYLVDLKTGRLVDSNAKLNKQISCGEDVISRIIYSLREGGLDHLHRLVIETINELLAEIYQRNSIDSSNVYDMVVAGNTIMTHIFLGLTPRYLREEPYVPLTTHFAPVPAGELGISINPNASVYCVPCVAAYVGGDIVAGVLSSGLYKKDNLSLFIDVGTNGEIVLGGSDFMMTDACSAGPAFEGAGIKWGMRGIKGAIEDVTISSQTLEPRIKVIGDVPPQGICGSGLISALAEMLVTGVIDRSGHIALKFVDAKMGNRTRARAGEHGAEYVIAWAADTGVGQDIAISEVDINNLIRAKAAVYAGIAVMLEKSEVDPQSLDEMLIGGAFGQHINVEEAIQIGLLPDIPWEKFKYLGNTSAWGAYTVLLSRHARAKADEIAGKMTYLELIADNAFMNEFTAALFLPHTRIEQFPSVKKLLEESSGAKK